MGKKGRYTRKRKKTKKKNNRFILFLFIIVIVTVCFIITKRENENLAVTTSASIGEIIDIIEEGQANVNRYIVYGTHLNIEGALTITPGDIENVQLVAKKSSGEEVEIKTTYEYENGNITFTTLDKINLGLDLESLDNENYYILLKITYPNEEVKYYSLENDSEYTKPIEYYTLTRNNTNNKILDGVLYLNKADTLANHKEKVKPLNSANINYQCDKLVDADNYKGASIPEFSYIKAIYNATLKALRVSDGSQLSAVLIGEEPNDLMGGIHNNSLPFFNTSCPYLNPIEADYHWLTDEITEINKVGGSVWDNNAEDNTLIMGEQLSTYKTDNAGNEDITWKFMNYRDTGSAIREYRFKNFKKDFAQSRMNDDIEKRVRNAFLKYYKTLSDNSHKLLRSDKASFKFYEQNLKISLDFANGRVTVYCLDPYVTQLRECIGYFKATFDISTGEVV